MENIKPRKSLADYYIRINSIVRITVDRKTNSTGLKIKGSHWSKCRVGFTVSHRGQLGQQDYFSVTLLSLFSFVLKLSSRLTYLLTGPKSRHFC